MLDSSPVDSGSNFDRLKSQTIQPPSNLSGPTSLAHFIGGSRSVQNRDLKLGLRRPGQDDHPSLKHLETDQAPVKSFLSDARVPLPGLVSGGAESRTPPAKAASFPLASHSSANDKKAHADDLRPLRPMHTGNKSASDAPTPTEVKPTPSRHQQVQQDEEPTEKNTASLTRLRSSNLVKQRLGSWGQPSPENTESPSPSATAFTTSPPPIAPIKRASVLDRWGRDEPDRPSSPPSKATDNAPPRRANSPEEITTVKSRFGKDDPNIPLPRVWPPPGRVSPQSSMPPEHDTSTPVESRSWMRSPHNQVLPSPSPSKQASFEQKSSAVVQTEEAQGLAHVGAVCVGFTIIEADKDLPTANKRSSKRS